MSSDPGKKPTRLGNLGASAGCLLDIRGDLLPWCTGDVPLSGVETPGKESELADVAGFIGDARTPVTCVSFFGVARAGASHISTSLEVSESSNEIISAGLGWFCWIEMSGGTSLAGTTLPSEVSLEDVPSPRSDFVDSGCPGFLDVSTRVGCKGLNEKEVVGVSVSLERSRGDSPVDRFVSGCSDTVVLAFLFPRSRPVSEGLPNVGLE